MDIRRLYRLSLRARAGEAREPYSDELAAFLCELDTETCFQLVEAAYRAQNKKTPSPKTRGS